MGPCNYFCIVLWKLFGMGFWFCFVWLFSFFMQALYFVLGLEDVSV